MTEELMIPITKKLLKDEIEHLNDTIFKDQLNLSKVKIVLEDELEDWGICFIDNRGKINLALVPNFPDLELFRAVLKNGLLHVYQLLIEKKQNIEGFTHFYSELLNEYEINSETIH